MILYIIEAICLLIFTVSLVCYFSHESTPYYVRFLVNASFNVSFLCFLILTIDIYETAVDEEAADHLTLAWTIIYDLNFFICWLILPIVQEYEDSGEFTKLGKLKESLKTNGIMIGAILCGAIILVIYLVIVGKFTISQLPSVFATIVNVFGLSLVSVMLGFGLVSFPKENFLKIDYKKRVNKCHRMAHAIKEEQQKLKEELFEISKVLETRQRSPESDGHEAEMLYMIQQNIDFNNFRSYADPNEKIQKLNNPSLNTILKKRIIAFNAAESELDEFVDELRDISVSHSKNYYLYPRIFYITIFAITTIISTLIFIAETSTFISVFEYINVLGLVNWENPASYFLNCFFIFYIVYIVTHTVFRIKLYKVFSLHKKHSSSSSLTFSAINLARVCYPLCFNYLSITHIEHAAFLNFFGDMNLNTGLSWIFPLLMIVFGIFNILDIYDTIMGYLGLGSYDFDEDDAKEKAEDGKKILSERFQNRNIDNNKVEMTMLL